MLPTTLPCGARTFLGDASEEASTRPSGRLVRRTHKRTRQLPLSSPAFAGYVAELHVSDDTGPESPPSSLE